jgi:hypothetical protein
MPSGAISLIEAAKHGDNPVSRGMIETIIIESPVIEQLHWMPFAGVAYRQLEEGTLPSVGFRNVNEGYSQSYGSDNESFWGVAILGGEYKVDNFLVNVVATEADLEAKQIRKLAKANAMRFDYEFFEGTGSVASKGFKGLKQLVSEGKGQTVSNGTATISLDKLDEAHDAFLNQGGPDVIFANRTIRRQITSKARTSVTGVSLIDVGTDVFGRQVTMWNDVPIRHPLNGINSSGTVTSLLPFTEASSTSSLWMLKFGEEDVCGLLGKGGSFDVKRFGELQASPQRMGRLEWYPGLAVFNQYSVVRLSAITAS